MTGVQLHSRKHWGQHSNYLTEQKTEEGEVYEEGVVTIEDMKVEEEEPEMEDEEEKEMEKDDNVEAAGNTEETVTVNRTLEIDSYHRIERGTPLPAPLDHWKRLCTSPMEQAHFCNTTTKPGMLATMGRDSTRTRATDEEIRAAAQRGDTNVEGATRVVVANGTSGDVSMTRITPTTTSVTAAEPVEGNENGDSLSSESPEVSKAPADRRSCM
ncbi:hypothetical protein BDD12DRAFT_894336 [Trichophaea hybrida]|nr:hypothetical protein BDD12DRAFT_894336 [Trichophaea hybrida]